MRECSRLHPLVGTNVEESDGQRVRRRRVSLWPDLVHRQTANIRSKRTVHGLAKSVSKKGGKRKIRVNTVASAGPDKYTHGERDGS